MRDRISFNIDKPAQYYRGIRVKADLGLHDDVVSRLLPHLKAGSKVLDFGCGEGALSQRLADIGAEVLAVDVDHDAFKASTPFVRVDFNDSSDVSKFIEGHRGVFDIVLGVEVIEHVENPWQYMRDLGSLVRVGGFVLVSTPNVTSWYSRINSLFRGRFHQFEDADCEYGHINPVAADELRLIAEKSGMDVISMVPAGSLPRLWLAGSPARLAANMLGFLASFVMHGTWDGWCVVALFRKKDGSA